MKWILVFLQLLFKLLCVHGQLHVEHVLDRICVPLLCELLDDILVSSYEQQCGPIVQFEGVPHVELTIVDAGMLYVVADDCLTQHVCGLLLVKLGAVDSNEGDFREVDKFCLKLFKLGKHVNAVDAAACPEVGDDDLVFELVLHRQGLVIERVQPLQVVVLTQLLLKVYFRADVFF